MNRLVAVFMGITLFGLVGEIVQGDVNPGVAVASLVLAAFAIGLAVVRTVRNAVKLGEQPDVELARSILRDHVACFIAIAALLVLQAFAAY
jgi:hypothetical protein